MDKPDSVTLIHEIDLELRIVGLAVGCAVAAYPFLKGHFAANGSELSPVVGLLWIFGGLAIAGFFALGNSTMLTVDNGEVTVRTKGPLGRRRKVLSVSAVEYVAVQQIPTRMGRRQFYVVVKIKGRWQLFAGDSTTDEEAAEEERQAVLRALARTEES